MQANAQRVSLRAVASEHCTRKIRSRSYFGDLRLSSKNVVVARRSSDKWRGAAHVLCRSNGGESESITGAGTSQPWQFVEYHSKKKERQTDEQGNLIKNEDTLKVPEPFANCAQARLDLVIRATARELSTADAPTQEELQACEELIRRKLRILIAAVPGVEGHASASGGTESVQLQEGQLIRLALAAEDPTRQLIILKELLPSCDVADLIRSRPSLLLISVDTIRRRIAAGK